jgi:hypothetical protein
MARKKTLEQTHSGFNTRSFASRSVPTTCPVCAETPAVAKGEKPHQVMEAHLIAQHRPDAPCPREHQTDRSLDWKLDWDAVLHHQSGIWYCAECGFYLKAK